METRRVFTNARTGYINTIRHAKKAYWQRIVRLSGETDPWGLAYKILANRLKSSTLMVSMRSENDVITTPHDICEFLLRGLLPDDNIHNDNAENTVIREAVTQLQAVQDVQDVLVESRVSPDELEDAVARQKSGKAQGLDGIKAEVVKRTISRIRLLYLDIVNKMFQSGEFPKS